MSYLRVLVAGRYCCIISMSCYLNVETIEALGKEFEKDFPEISKSNAFVYEIEKGPFDGYIMIQADFDKILENSKNKEEMKNRVISQYFPIDKIGGRII